MARYSLCFLLLVAGCGKKQQRALPQDVYTEKRDGIELHVKRLSPAQTHKQFGRNLINLGYQPIKLSIVNMSTDQLLVRASSIDLPLVPAEEVREQTKRSVLGLLAGPAYLSALFAWPVLLPIVGIGTWLCARNRYVKRKISEKFFGEDKAIELLPFERLSRFIFVPVETPMDTFTLHCFKRQEKVYVPFTVTLP